VAQERERLDRAFDALQAANDDLRDALLVHKDATSEAVRRMTDGSLTADSVRTGAAPEIRVDLTEAMERFATARHEARLAVIAYLSANSEASIADIGRAFGFSRQLATRLAHEAAQTADSS
jgi:hypothetical protein